MALLPDVTDFAINFLNDGFRAYWSQKHVRLLLRYHWQYGLYMPDIAVGNDSSRRWFNGLAPPQFMALCPGPTIGDCSTVKPDNMAADARHCSVKQQCTELFAWFGPAFPHPLN